MTHVADTNHQTSTSDLATVYREWKIFIDSVDALVREHDLTTEVVFHGTSSGPLETIMLDGLQPSSVNEAFLQRPEAACLGSFWGQATTAGWYAFDDVENRNPFDKPVLLMAFTDQLETWGELNADRWSVEHPVDDRFKANAKKLLPALDQGTLDLSWQEGLSEIGAIFLLHSDEIPPTEFKAVSTLAEVVAALEAANALKATVPGF